MEVVSANTCHFFDTYNSKAREGMKMCVTNNQGLMVPNTQGLMIKKKN